MFIVADLVSLRFKAETDNRKHEIEQKCLLDGVLTTQFA